MNKFFLLLAGPPKAKVSFLSTFLYIGYIFLTVFIYVSGRDVDVVVTASGATKPVPGYFVYVAFRVELEGTIILRCSHIMFAHCPKCIRVSDSYSLRVSVEGVYVGREKWLKPFG